MMFINEIHNSIETIVCAKKKIGLTGRQENFHLDGLSSIQHHSHLDPKPISRINWAKPLRNSSKLTLTNSNLLH